MFKLFLVPHVNMTCVLEKINNDSDLEGLTVTSHIHVVAHISILERPVFNLKGKFTLF